MGYVVLAFGAVCGRYDVAFWQLGAVVVALSIAIAGLSVVLKSKNAS